MGWVKELVKVNFPLGEGGGYVVAEDDDSSNSAVLFALVIMLCECVETDR